MQVPVDVQPVIATMYGMQLRHPATSSWISLLRLWSLVAVMLLPVLAWAQIDYPNRRGSFTAGELAMLPPYCKNMQGFPGYEGREGNRWRSMMGSDFQHIHHYCRGLRDVYYITYGLPTPVQRTFLWERAIDEYNYMIRNSRPTMPLMPEIFFRRGEAQVKLGRLPEAEASFAAARKLKADYVPAYVAWADELLKLKLDARASEQIGRAHV